MTDKNTDNLLPHINTINIYTDGSLKRTKNGDICGYGIYFPNGELKNVSAPFTIGKISNNRAELHAIYQAILRVIKNYTFNEINIYTDSEYAQKSLTLWITSWKKNNWKNSKRQEIENKDIIVKIDKYLQKYNKKINIKWVRAHTRGKDIDSINNAIADGLANKGAEIYKRRILGIY